MKKEQKQILNDLKKTLKEQFPLIRNVARRENTIHFFGGTHLFEGEMIKGGLDRVTGVEQDLSSYTNFIDGLEIPGLTWERKLHYPKTYKVPYILVTLKA
jgi:hypothetical protein